VSWKVALNYEKQCFEKAQGFKQNLIKLAPNSIQTTSFLGLLFQELTLSFAKVNGIQGVHNFGKIKCSISQVHLMHLQIP
jgi:hypothetical protein